MTNPDVIDLARRFMEAAEAGDVEAARDCFHPDAGIWHNYDQKTQTVEENMALLSWMVSAFGKRHYAIKRLEPIEGGYLQQHTLHITLKNGSEIETDALAVVEVRENRIARIEEYLDPTAILAAAKSA